MTTSHRSASAAAANESNTKRMVFGVDGDRDITIGAAVKARMAYVQIAKVGVEVDHCEHMISEIDRWIRAYIANRA